MYKVEPLWSNERAGGGRQTGPLTSHSSQGGHNSPVQLNQLFAIFFHQVLNDDDVRLILSPSRSANVTIFGFQ